MAQEKSEAAIAAQKETDAIVEILNRLPENDSTVLRAYIIKIQKQKVDLHANLNKYKKAISLLKSLMNEI